LKYNNHMVSLSSKSQLHPVYDEDNILFEPHRTPPVHKWESEKCDR